MVKKILLLFSFFCMIYAKPFAQNTEDGNVNSYELKAGDTLIYEVNKHGKNYRLIITLTGETYIDSKIVGSITFDWETTGDTIMKGSVTIAKNAREDASNYLWELSKGPATLKTQTFLWMSFRGFHSLLENGSMEMRDDQKSIYKMANGSGNHAIVFKGKATRISVLRASVPSSGHFFNFWPSQSSNALILSVNMGWTMNLTEIR